MHDDDDDWDVNGCNHDDYDVDILDGRAHCWRCGHRWYVSEDEVQRQISAMADYDRYLEEEYRKQWWRDLWDKIKAPFRIFRLRRRTVAIDDDEIPF